MNIHDAIVLEGLIDAHGLRGVLDTLAVICLEKAEHLVYTWQDTTQSKVWQKVSKRIGDMVLPDDLS